MTVSLGVQVVAVQVKEKIVREKGEIVETVKEGRLTLSFDGDEAPVEELVALINGERVLLGLASSQRTLDEWAKERTGITGVTFTGGGRTVTLGSETEVPEVETDAVAIGEGR